MYIKHLFLRGMLKEKVYSVTITDLMPLTQRIRDECVKIEGSEIALHAHENIAKRINICIASDGKRIKDVI